MENKSCNNCRFAIFQDFGYSNYTVEGTDFICAKSLHPEGQFDRFYGTDDRLNFGATCSGHVQGDPVEMDVEQESVAYLTADQKDVWDMVK